MEPGPSAVITAVRSRIAASRRRSRSLARRVEHKPGASSRIGRRVLRALATLRLALTNVSKALAKLGRAKVVRGDPSLRECVAIVDEVDRLHRALEAIVG
jgi:hypothetical protein